MKNKINDYDFSLFILLIFYYLLLIFINYYLFIINYYKTKFSEFSADYFSMLFIF